MARGAEVLRIPISISPFPHSGIRVVRLGQLQAFRIMIKDSRTETYPSDRNGGGAATEKSK